METPSLILALPDFDEAHAALQPIFEGGLCIWAWALGPGGTTIVPRRNSAAMNERRGIHEQ